jgi:hypothetical protein
MSRFTLIRSFQTIKPSFTQSRSNYCNGCRYTDINKPVFSPFFACLTLGSFFTYIHLVRSRQQYESLYLQIHELKTEINTMKK